MSLLPSKGKQGGLEGSVTQNVSLIMLNTPLSPAAHGAKSAPSQGTRGLCHLPVLYFISGHSWPLALNFKLW